MAAQPVPYRTTEASPTMESLRADGVNRVFPIGARPVQLHKVRDGRLRGGRPRSRGELRAASAAALSPHHVRAMAEALGRTVPASKYSPSMDLHLGPRHRGLAPGDRAMLDAWERDLLTSSPS